jgi:hypothetical protein
MLSQQQQQHHFSLKSMLQMRIMQQKICNCSIPPLFSLHRRHRRRRFFYRRRQLICCVWAKSYRHQPLN